MTEPTARPLLELRGISKRFGRNQALEDVSFTLKAGEVHALCGENGAGKSTLMNIIDGILAPDAGQILLNGEPVKIMGPAHAQLLGIGLVHQEISLCPDATVAENIFISQTNQSRRLLVDHEKLNRDAAVVLRRLRADISPAALVADLSICEQQLVEIAKALTLDCQVLIFDEPTAALTENEAEALFAVISDLRASGLGIIYISHRMAEIFGRCDRVTVLRDGRFVSTDPIEELTPALLVKRLVGRDLGTLYPAKQQSQGQRDRVLEVQGLSDGRRFADISFSVNAGEILGIGGLMGAGRSEVAEAICALRPSSAGHIQLEGQPFQPRHYRDAIESGVVYLSEDRKQEGVFLELSIAANVSAMNVDQLSSKGLIDTRRESEQAQTLGSRMSLKSAGMSSAVGNLSGGNQQKVAIAKLLAVKPRVMFMDEPTRGVDVKAKLEIHTILRDLASQGIAVVVISSELPELIGLCDRVVVLREGRLAGELEGAEVNEESIMHLASGLHQADIPQVKAFA